MSIMSRLLARMAGLPPAQRSPIGVDKGLRVPMPDGVTLLADRYYPRDRANAPLILMRTPYGRRNYGAFAEIFAERGYQAIVQSCRGTFGSGGCFNPFRDEEGDGRATLDWMAAQSWFGGSVGLFGASYMGFAQWAMAPDAPPYVKAMAVQIAAADRRSSYYPGESFALDNALSWTHTIKHQEEGFLRSQLAVFRQRGALAKAFDHLPLDEADQVTFGETIPWYQDWLVHTEPNDPFWQEINFHDRLEAVSAPTNFVGGWYDYFLPSLLSDYAALRQAGHAPFLTIGPWKHTDTAAPFAGLRESFTWFDAHLQGDRSGLREKPVRIFVMGLQRWRDFPEWPPMAVLEKWCLQEHGGLMRTMPESSDPDCYDYDPADPTPALGGAVLGMHGGTLDNRTLESRPDVLCYTTDLLDMEYEIIGTVAVNLCVKSSLEHTDFFARLCDVDPSGRSINICDGLVRLWPGRVPAKADGTLSVHIDLSPTAYCFLPGHRIRLQISSGAHPRFARNPGSGEPLASAVTLKVAHQRIFHDPSHVSALYLPMRRPVAMQ